MAFDLDEYMADTLHAYLKQRAAEVSPRAAIHLYCSTDSPAKWCGWLHIGRWRDDNATVYSTGKYLNIRDVVDELIANARDKMLDYEREITTKLAHDIMDCTREFGECTPTRLRGKGHAQDIIDTFGSRACEEAQSIADSGPFVITADDITPNAPADTSNIPF